MRRFAVLLSALTLANCRVLLPWGPTAVGQEASPVAAEVTLERLMVYQPSTRPSMPLTGSGDHCSWRCLGSTCSSRTVKVLRSARS